MIKKISARAVALLSITLLFFACSQEAVVSLDQETKAEQLVVSNEDAFISLAKATDVAAAFFGTLSKDLATKSSICLTSTETIRDSKSNNDPLMYIMNYAHGGFVIVGANKNYYPVLAYSDKNNFEITENMPFGLSMWLDETKEAIRQSETMDEDTKSQMRSLWRGYEAVINTITPTIKTKSNPAQEAAFQARIAELQEGDGAGYEFYRLSEAFYLGAFPDTYGAYLHYCGMANEIESPLQYTIIGFKGGEVVNGTGPLLSTKWHQYSPYNDLCGSNDQAAGCATIAVAQIMKYHQYPNYFNFDNMPNTGATTYTKNYIRDVGVALGIDYNSGNSNVNKNKTKATLQNFGYNATLTNYDPVAARNELLIHGRPLLMRGETNNSEGHIWVCDGARNSYCYMSYFIEFLAWGNSYTNIDYAPTLESPSTINGVSVLFFNMNWGWYSTPSGWYIHNNVNTAEGNLQYNRENIYVSK
jgi:Peptidase C10 family.